MFTFHKPKVFRSPNGCCICRAKSSSKKYESVFKTCFNLEEKRFGEICNACVLLVKRYLKLPAGSTRHWNHVVDARSGPGIKSLVKSRGKKQLNAAAAASAEKAKTENEVKDNDTPIKKKHVYRRKRTASELVPVKNRSRNPSIAVSDFLDMNIWTRQKVCCGTIFKGPFGEVVIDPRFLTKCTNCKTNADTVVVPDSTDAVADGIVAEEEFLLSDISADDVSDAEPLAASVPKMEEDDEGFFDKPSISPSSVSPPPAAAPPAAALDLKLLPRETDLADTGQLDV